MKGEKEKQREEEEKEEWRREQWATHKEGIQMVVIVPIRPVSGRPAQLGKPRCLFCLPRHRPKRKAIRDSPESFGDAMLFAASPASF